MIDAFVARTWFAKHRNERQGWRCTATPWHVLAVLFTVFVALTLPLVAIATPRAKTNVVLIISDDMGYADMPRFGQEMGIPMPQMERLFRGGVTFTDAYASAPICVPSRMGIVTGRHQARWGAYTNVYDNQQAYHRFQRETTLPQYFKDAGYATALIGKWHLTDFDTLLKRDPKARPPSEYLPESKGFDEVTVITGGMSGYFPGARLYHQGGVISEAPEYLTDYFGKLAADFILKRSEAPFFLVLAFNAVHAPLHALDDDIAEFGGLARYRKDRYVPQLKIEDRDARMDRQVYSGMMRAMDRNIGRVLDALESADVEGDTLVIFVNDNGGPSPTAQVHSYTQAANFPFRGYKFDCWEGGIRVPMAIRWPGRVPVGRIFSGLTSTMDILPTVLHACGLAPQRGIELDGTDLIPYLDGSRPGAPHGFLCWQAYFGNEKTTGQAAIRDHRWKLHQFASVSSEPELDRWALYDLSIDPGETTDLSKRHPDVVARLDAAWRSWKIQMKPLDESPVKAPGT